MRLAGSLLRVAVAVAIINASVRVGFAYWAFYQLRDDAEQTAIFGAKEPEWALQTAVLDKADELFLPLEAEDVTVTRSGFRTVIEASYVQPIEYFPSQSYPMKFTFAVEGFRVNTNTID
jgi:hypothetical protein